MGDAQMPKKDPNAVALGRKGGLKGGVARASSMSPEERAESAKRAAEARWSVPAATHMGEIRIGELCLPCYVLDDERRVFSQGGILAALGMSTGGQGNTGLGNDRLARFIQGRAIAPHVSVGLATAFREPFKFRLPTNAGANLNDGFARGYEAALLVELCDSILKAREEGLQSQQLGIAHRAEILIRGFATTGVVALVDEATGFQYARARRALAEILEKFIAKELAAWVKTFDDDYYRHLFRLRRVADADDLRKRPGYFGHLTNDIVYDRLAPGVLEELRKKNPKAESGSRRSKHHQWLTAGHGHPKLREHLAKVNALMEISPDYKTFIEYLNRVAPRYGATLEMFSVAQMKIEDEDFGDGA